MHENQQKISFIARCKTECSVSRRQVAGKCFKNHMKNSFMISFSEVVNYSPSMTTFS